MTMLKNIDFMLTLLESSEILRSNMPYAVVEKKKIKIKLLI